MVGWVSCGAGYRLPQVAWIGIYLSVIRSGKEADTSDPGTGGKEPTMVEARNGKRMLQGSMTALVTPFRDGAVDFSALERLVERQIEGGTDWLVPCGTTGETPTLTRAEREQVLASVLKHTNGRCGVMVGAGSNSTANTIERCREAVGAGADAVMLVAPYYNRPAQEGLYRHFASVAESVELPIVLYNVPARTGVTIGVEVVVRLRAAYGHIVAIKDATGCLDGVTEMLTRCDITVLSGDDTLTWPMLSLGAKGVVSVIANLCPDLVKSMVTAGRDGHYESGLALHRKLFDLASGIGEYGPNPIPIKTALSIRGLIREEFRLPLCPLSADARSVIETVLRRHELLGAGS